MLKELRTLRPYIKKYRLSYVIGILFLLLTNSGQIVIPQLLGRTIDTINQGDFALRDIIWPLIVMVVLAVVVALGRSGWRWAILGSARKIEYDIRARLYDHLLTLSSGFYNRMKTGDLMARATNDMMNVRSAVGIGFVTAVDGILMIAAILIIMFGQNPRVALLCIIPMPVVTVLVLGVGKALGERFRRVQEEFSHLSEHVQEALSGIKVLKSFVRESYSSNQFADKNDRYRTENLHLVRIWGLFFPIISFLAGVSTLVLLRVGGVAVIDGSMTPGTFVAFMSYLAMIVWPMAGAGYTVNMFQRGAASLGRINEIFSEEPEIRSPENPVTTVPDGGVRLTNLSYQYGDNEGPVLVDIDFEAAEGMTVGILGRTGSGKSTLLKLIPRILDPKDDSLYLGGVDVKRYDLATLREFVGMVPQDTFLFSATVRDNIRYGKDGATDEEIREAARLSTIDRDLADFPDGYETEIGERGVTLSGGQKQRIAISRAILANPELLIFDDALSAVDTETEELILSRFLELRQGKTNIIVSNRISTLAGADRIYVLDAGRIVDSGSHLELMQRDGLYRQIATLQSLAGVDA